MDRAKILYVVLGILVLAVIIYVFGFIERPKVASRQNGTQSASLAVPEKQDNPEIAQNKTFNNTSVPQDTKKPDVSIAEVTSQLEKLETQIEELAEKYNILQKEVNEHYGEVWGMEPGFHPIKEANAQRAKYYSWSIIAKIDDHEIRIDKIERALNPNAYP